MFGQVIAALMCAGARILTGAQARWVGCAPLDVQRIYFANHTSHLDFVLLWSSLPARLRHKTRPVAARDYWCRGPLRRFLIERVFRGVLVDRAHFDRDREASPIQPMLSALDAGDSLIFFPEGSRGPGPEVQPFKSGIFHLAHARLNVELVPVWIQNSYRVMPRGYLFPIPLLCSVTFGKPAILTQDEQKHEFLARMRDSLAGLESV
jgi:1-acyl-sn-glycerol-3-phosphate acyltransferase